MNPMIEVLESRFLLSAQPLTVFSTDTLVASTPFTTSASVAVNAAAPLDTVAFGDSISESAHGVIAASSDVVIGAVGRPARRLLPLTPVGIYGGDITVTLAVDPARRNYVSLKLWGGDDATQDIGRLYLYVPQNGVNYQVGYRHEGDYMPLSVTANHQPLPGRFFYSTTLLPLSMTQGKTSLTLKIVSTGRLYGLGNGFESSGGNYQFNMKQPSRGIYRAYTHTQAYLDVTGEVQGAAPVVTTKPTGSGEATLSPGGAYYTGVNNRVKSRLSAATSVTSLTESDVEFLAQSYFTIGSTTTPLAGYRNPAVVDKMRDLIDAYARDYFTTPGKVNDWGGAYGPIGWGVKLMQSQLTSDLDVSVDYGPAGGIKTRRQAWGELLTASRDFGRFNRDNRYITNQSVSADTNIYKANAGLLALGNANAFTESAARRYLKESAGLQPWLGSDLSSGGSSLKYGSNYFMVTPDGLTREWGYAGTYSEMQSSIANFFSMTGDTAFRDQAVRIARAMAYMRRPTVEVSGGNFYRNVEREGLLAWRGVGDSDGNFASDTSYGDTATFGNGLHTAAVTGDATLIGYAKQMLLDNQYFARLSADTRYYNNLDVFGDYATVKGAIDIGARLPMTDGQPDFVWSDETNGIIVMKNAGERLWVEPFWQAKGGTGVNGVGRFHLSTAAYDQYGTFEVNTQLTSNNGSVFVRPNYIDKPETNFFVPSDNPSNAYAGEKLPIADAPADAADGTPFRGRVNFYAFRFGRYVIGLNTTADRSYALKLPVGVTTATDLSTGANVSSNVSVGPNSTVVLSLGAADDAAPVPTAPLLVTANGTATQISLQWSAASGAQTYTLKRSPLPGGPYVTIASAIVGTTYVDTTTATGQQYYYAVSASNNNGESYDSMELLANAGLPAPWSAQDVGTVVTPGFSKYTGTTFTLNGSGTDIGGAGDSLHYAYRPITGDETLIARLAGVTTGGAVNDKVGLMMRESLAVSARSVAVLVDLSTATARQAARSSTGGGTTWTNGPVGIAAPCWFKLQRAGNAFSGAVSADGVNWTVVTSSTVSMAATIYAGMAVCSRDGALNTSRFDQVSLATSGRVSTSPMLVNPTASPSVVTGKSTTLSVVGADDGGSANLRYRWSVLGTPPAGVMFSVNDSNAARISTATFTASGTYSFVVTATDAPGLGTSVRVDVVVSPVLTGLSVSPASVMLSMGAAKTFVAVGRDQFGASMSASATWSVSSGGGQITPTGVYTAPFTTRSATITAASAGFTACAQVTIVNSIPSAPSSVKAATLSSSQITLSWLDNSINETGFRIERSTDLAGPWSLAYNGTLADQTSYTVAGLKTKTRYYFRVLAYNARGTSTYSNVISVLTF